MKNFYLLFVFFAIGSYALGVNEVNITGKQTVASYTDTKVTISDKSELHLTSATPLTNSTVHLIGEDSWLYFDNLRPSQVVANWLKYIYVGETAATHNTNVRVEVFLTGTVVIPHSPSFKPLEVFKEKNFGGDSQKYEILTFHRGLGDMNKSIRSFKLRKGYMATFASNTDGTGYSRVFIADKEDLELAEMPDLLDQTINFIRVFRWKWPTKKGWNGSNAEQLNTIQATWYYNWDAAGNTSYLDAEYIPMRHNKYWAGWETINSRENSTHVLGFNEPNQDEAGGGSDMTVDDCVALWPNLMKSGLRIGSVAPTDGGLNYLYEFVDKCDALNYRIDFIAVHFYRGAQTPTNYYNFLKGIHERTKRPIWITEWNNGANWTSESWPSNAADQQAKQKNDMTAFFNMLDTVSFVERHAVYNWVEWKRYMIDTDKGNTVITPAGEMMRNFKSVQAYNPKKEFIPLPWKYLAPSITSTKVSNDQDKFTITLDTDKNGGLTQAILVEKKINDGEFILVDSIVDTNKKDLEYAIVADGNKTSYRVRYLGKGAAYSPYSKESSYLITPNEDIQKGQFSVSSLDETVLNFGKRFSTNPIAIFGTPTYKNVDAITTRITTINSRNLSFSFKPWAYVGATTLSKTDIIPFLFFEAGTYDFGGLKAIAEKTTANGEWKTIDFPEAFESTPAVFATITSNRASTALAIRIKNVTKTSFDILLQREATQSYTISTENISYFAIEQGEGNIKGKKVIVGMTEENAVGTTHLTSGLAKVDWGNAFSEIPLFFASMQTANDTRGAFLRVRYLTETGAQFFKQIEASNVFIGSKETAAWMAIEAGTNGSSIDTEYTTDENSNSISIYPNPATDYIKFQNQERKEVRIIIMDMIGRQIINKTTNNDQIDIEELQNGYYIISIDGKTAKLIKK